MFGELEACYTTKNSRQNCVIVYLKKTQTCPTAADTWWSEERYTGENIRLLYNTQHYASKKHIYGRLLMIDFDKTFDIVDWSFTEFFWLYLNIWFFFNNRYKAMVFGTTSSHKKAYVQ